MNFDILKKGECIDTYKIGLKTYYIVLYNNKEYKIIEYKQKIKIEEV